MKAVRLAIVVLAFVHPAIASLLAAAPTYDGKTLRQWKRLASDSNPKSQVEAFDAIGGWMITASKELPEAKDDSNKDKKAASDLATKIREQLNFLNNSLDNKTDKAIVKSILTTYTKLTWTYVLSTSADGVTTVFLTRQILQSSRCGDLRILAAKALGKMASDMPGSQEFLGLFIKKVLGSLTSSIHRHSSGTGENAVTLFGPVDDAIISALGRYTVSDYIAKEIEKKGGKVRFWSADSPPAAWLEIDFSGSAIRDGELNRIILALAHAADEEKFTAHIAQIPGQRRVNISLNCANTNISDSGLDSLHELFRTKTEADLRLVMDLSGSRIMDGCSTKLPRLAQLRVARTHFGNEGLACILDGDQLEMLDLSSTLVTDIGLYPLRNMPSLISLDVSQSKIGDSSSFCFCNLGSLTSLNASKTRITDDWLRRVPRTLKKLDVSSNAIGNESLAAVACLPALETLNLSSTNISGGGPTFCFLRELHNLTSLNMSNTNVTDGFLTHLSHATAICDLDISHTKIANGLAPLASLSNWVKIDLTGTYVTDDAVSLLESLSWRRPAEPTRPGNISPKTDSKSKSISCISEGNEPFETKGNELRLNTTSVGFRAIERIRRSIPTVNVYSSFD